METCPFIVDLPIQNPFIVFILRATRGEFSSFLVTHYRLDPPALAASQDCYECWWIRRPGPPTRCWTTNGGFKEENIVDVSMVYHHPVFKV